MIKILRVNFQVYQSLSEFEGGLYYKGTNNQEKYLDILATAHFTSDSFLQSNQKYSNFLLHQCRFKGKNVFSKIFNLLEIYWYNIKYVKKNEADLYHISLTASHIRFLFVFIFPTLFPRKKFLLRLSTPAVNKNKLVRYLLDLIISLNILAFKHVGSSTDNNLKKFHIPKRKYVELIGSGMDLGYKDRTFNNFNLMYLGTLYSREIWKSVRGLALFIKENPSIKVTYDIVGKGPEKDTLELKNEIKRHGLENIVTYHGFLSDAKVEEIIYRCDYGVAYVPVNDYFQNDSGKTIAYALAGMAIIATANKFRSKWVTEDVGVLCQDNPESFAKSLKTLYDNSDKYNSEVIKKHFYQFSSEFATKNSYIPAIEKIINSNSY